MKAIVYTKDGCKYCKWVKRLLTDHNVSYQEKNIYNDDEAMKYFKAQEFSTTPQVFIDDEYVGGFERTLAHLKGWNIDTVTDDCD